MKAGELIDFLMLYDKDDEVQIEIYETLSDNYIDTTAAITIVEENANVPTLRIDVEIQSVPLRCARETGITWNLSPRKCPHPQMRQFCASAASNRFSRIERSAPAEHHQCFYIYRKGQNPRCRKYRRGRGIPCCSA